ncbi:MAG: hypothetical protein A3H69_04340 [Candidatus Sungbacteria bacterium RIFCSPLOWO2_02_FULL_47_9]|nr:MAG: hypothetical protein A3H69_04340 [Candidatus Sungbacteria bacterium RIFCSPLOWO2_02_FULL_47_9]
MRDIQYWKPTYLTISSNPFYAYLILFFVLLVATRRKLPFRFFLYCFFFMGFAFYAFRFMPFFVFSTIPVLWSIDKDKRIHVPVFLFLIFLAVAEAVIVHNVATHVVFVPKPQAIRELFEEKNIFVNDAPVRAFEYIKTHPMPDRMFNEFDWGGALTWYYPERKVFINGNMVHWKDVNGHYIYADSNAIKGAKENWRELIRYYGINWFLVRANTPISTVLSELPTEWANVYRDEKAVIFVKK